MTKALTIDNYGVPAHQRYATDQLNLDLTLIHDASLIPVHSDAAVGKSTLASKWEELFETHLHRHPFANFCPPPRYMMMRNRFFSYAISPEFSWLDQEEAEDGDEEEKKEEQREAEIYKKKIQEKGSDVVPSALFEKERSTLLKLIDAIQSLNGLIKDIHARKLQYQKG